MRPLAAAVLLTALALSCDRGWSRSSSSSQGRTSMQPSAPPAPASPNESLERAVRAKLYGDPQLSGGGSIAVIADGGRVVLEGWVGSETERTLAEADAGTVPGVVEVDDRLMVRPSAAPPASCAPR